VVERPEKKVPREVHFFSGRFVREQTDDFTSETELVVRSKHPKVERNGRPLLTDETVHFTDIQTRPKEHKNPKKTSDCAPNTLQLLYPTTTAKISVQECRGFDHFVVAP
jgi:hypothetical protein